MSPAERFAQWLRGYLDARRIGPTALEGLSGQDVGRIRQELASATGELGQLGQMRELTPADMIGQVFAAQGQTIPLQEQQRVEHEQKQRAALQQRNEAGWIPRPSTQDVVELGGGYGIPRGVR